MTSSNVLPSWLRSSRFSPTPVRNRSIWPVGVEIARRDAQAGLVRRRGPNGGGGVLEPTVPAVQQQGVADALGPDDRRGQVEVEPAVAVGVERRDRRAEPGAGPADDGERAREVRRP